MPSLAKGPHGVKLVIFHRFLFKGNTIVDMVCAEMDCPMTSKEKRFLFLRMTCSRYMQLSRKTGSVEIARPGGGLQLQQALPRHSLIPQEMLSNKTWKNHEEAEKIQRVGGKHMKQNP